MLLWRQMLGLPGSPDPVFAKHEGRAGEKLEGEYDPNRLPQSNGSGDFMTQLTLNITVKNADLRHDLDPVLVLLRDASLPTEGVKEHFTNFLVAVDATGKLVGAIGMERYPDGTGLLRSAVVAPSLRNSGVGSLLYERLIESARSARICRMVLLTNTAEKYFARKGFRVIPRSSVTGPVTKSSEFVDACPASAVCMELVLKSGEQGMGMVSKHIRDQT